MRVQSFLGHLGGTNSLGSILLQLSVPLFACEQDDGIHLGEAFVSLCEYLSSS